MEINYWGSTTARNATWNDKKKEWTITVDRDGEEVVLHPKQLVFALGVSGKTNIPTLPGQDLFRGEQHHSSEHPARTPTRTSGSSSSARTTRRSTSAGRCERPART
jgi:putative flavoprotein involved in K+ transport